MYQLSISIDCGPPPGSNNGKRGAAGLCFLDRKKGEVWQTKFDEKSMVLKRQKFEIYGLKFMCFHVRDNQNIRSLTGNDWKKQKKTRPKIGQFTNKN
jgi:hypothetical protein